MAEVWVESEEVETAGVGCVGKGAGRQLNLTPWIRAAPTAFPHDAPACGERMCCLQVHTYFGPCDGTFFHYELIDHSLAVGRTKEGRKERRRKFG